MMVTVNVEGGAPMFPYTNPANDGILEKHGALEIYRQRVHSQYLLGAHTRDSAFTLLDAFSGIADARRDDVDWQAFPKLSAALTPSVIDQSRLTKQDEYVEWQSDARGGRLEEVTLTCDFVDYFAALAAKSFDAIVDGIRALYPSARPTVQELFGKGFDLATSSEDERLTRFIDQSRVNPWNNGERGILCLTHQSNNMFALFALATDCAKPNAKVPTTEICGMSACEPGRNSDPAVCQAIQGIARAERSLSLVDPAGVSIRRLTGVWELDGSQIDIEDPAQNRGLWTVSRGGHRATLRIHPSLTLAGAPITSGAQVARVLLVGATVVSAPDKALPFWARRGQESTRRIV